MDIKFTPSPIERAAELAGGASSLAKLVGVSPQAVYKWIAKGRPPTDRCVAVEAAVNGKVTRKQLRPELYAK